MRLIRAGRLLRGGISRGRCPTWAVMDFWPAGHRRCRVGVGAPGLAGSVTALLVVVWGRLGPPPPTGPARCASARRPRRRRQCRRQPACRPAYRSRPRCSRGRKAQAAQVGLDGLGIGLAGRNRADHVGQTVHAPVHLGPQPRPVGSAPPGPGEPADQGRAGRRRWLACRGKPSSQTSRLVLWSASPLASPGLSPWHARCPRSCQF